MPNLVHSLDASSLAKLINVCFITDSYSNKSKNIFTIHDCFGVTCNNVESIIDMLKSIYIDLYSQEGYTRQLDKQIISMIKNSYGENCLNEKTLKLKVEIKNQEVELKYPDVNTVFGNNEKFDFDSLKQSKYLLNS